MDLGSLKTRVYDTKLFNELQAIALANGLDVGNIPVDKEIVGVVFSTVRISHKIRGFSAIYKMHIDSKGITLHDTPTYSWSTPHELIIRAERR